MTTAETHLSELCRGSDIDAIVTRLRQVAPLDESPAAHNGSPSSASPSGRCDRRGLWGYQDNDGRTAFHWALALKNFELARTLMSPPYNSPVLTEDEEWTTPFATACSVGAPLELLQEILDKSIAELPEYISWKAEMARSSRRESAGMNSAVQATFDGQANGSPAAALTGPGTPGISIPRDASAEAAMAAIIESTDATGLTPLLFAAGRGHLNIVRFLVERGANLCQQNHRGQSALHRAVNRGNMELVEYLVSTSEKKNRTNKAAHRRFLDLQDFHGDSAIFYASLDNNEEMGRYLLRRGADRDLRNKDGKCFWEV